MTPLNKQKCERQYYIDWLRIILIISVFLFHIGMYFNSWDWHVKNAVQYEGMLKETMIFLSYWRMPLLFLISGAGTFYALGKRNAFQYIGERYKRLVIPLTIGIFTLVPVQVYVEKSENYSSLLSFYPHMFEGIYPSGNFSWHHLWFIVYLFVISLIISPLIKWFKSNSFKKFSNTMEKVASVPLGLNVIILPLFLSQYFLRPYFPENTHALVDDWAAMAYYVIFFLSGYILLSNNNIANHIMKQRSLYLLEAVLATTFMFSTRTLFRNHGALDFAWGTASIFVAWACGMAAIGYAKRYLNFDTPFRKLANEAIYPFYLLHQPVIIVVGYYALNWHMADGLKAGVLITSTFVISVMIYWILVKPFILTRIAFGMKVLKHNDKAIKPSAGRQLIPILLYWNSSKNK